MKLFIKADNYTAKFLVLITLIADIALIVFGIRDNTFNSSFAIACGLTILVIILWLLCRNIVVTIMGCVTFTFIMLNMCFLLLSMMNK